MQSHYTMQKQFQYSKMLLFLMMLLCLFVLGCNTQPKEEGFDVEAFLKLAHNPSVKLAHNSRVEPKEERSRSISKYDKLIKETASIYGFDWLLISAQISAESAFNSEAISYRGALGLMQIMPDTARWLGSNPSQLLSPKVNIELGCYYNFKIYSEIENCVTEQERLVLMLASYNAGPTRVKRLRDKYHTWDKIELHLPEETRVYVTKILNKYSEYRSISAI